MCDAWTPACALACAWACAAPAATQPARVPSSLRTPRTPRVISHPPPPPPSPPLAPPTLGSWVLRPSKRSARMAATACACCGSRTVINCRLRASRQSPGGRSHPARHSCHVHVHAMCTCMACTSSRQGATPRRRLAALRTLSLSGVCLLNEPTLVQLVDGCSARLSSLYLRGCSLLSADAIATVARTCVALRELDLEGVRSITVCPPYLPSLPALPSCPPYLPSLPALP